jgi:hypothetical protein
MVIMTKIADALLKDIEDHPLPTPFARSGETGLAAFNEFAEELVGRQLKSAHTEAKELDADIEQLQEKLAEKLLRQRQLAVTINALRESSLQKELRNRVPGELSALKKLDGVVRVEIVDDGIHLTTEPVVLEHEGIRYPMGTFTIRLDPQKCDIEAWTDDPRHPAGHHHPHVERRSLSCHGNIGLALIKAMAAYHYMDAATITMRWLRSYNAATTLHPIEEWLSEEQEAWTPSNKEEFHADL